MKTNFSAMTKLSVSCFCTAFLLSCCGTRGGKQPAAKDTLSEAKAAHATNLPGSDRDAHGCIGSAGYQWSEVRQKCIRIFEAGTQLISTTDPNATTAAYLVFGADSLQAELFLPGSTPYVLGRRALPQGGYAWNIEDDDTPNVRKIDGKWTAERRGQTIYQQRSK